MLPEETNSNLNEEAPVKISPESKGEEVFVDPKRPKFSWHNLSKKQKIVAAGLIAAVLLVAAAVQFNLFGKLYRAVNSANVTFYVRDSQSKAVIQDAVVKSSEGEFKTDSQGYVKADLPSGKQRVVVSAEKYLDKVVALDLARGKNDTIDVLLERAPPTTATIAGSVLSFVDKQPLAGVAIELLETQLKISTTSAQAGTFSFKVPPGKQILSFTLAGYTQTKKEVEAKDNKTTVIEVTLPPAGRAVFVSNRDGDSSIYTTNLDGSDLKKLVANQKGRDDHSAVVSPNRRQVLFKSNREGKVDEYGNFQDRLYLVDAEGNTLKKISDDTVYDEKWFPDSSQVAYSFKNQIKSYHVGNNNLKILVNAPAATASATYLNFSIAQNSKLLAYSNETGVYTANVDGSNQLKRGEEPYAYSLSFSADSTRLDYESYSSGALKHFQVNLSTGAKTELPLSSVRGRFVPREGGGFYDFEGITFPSGKKIAYVSYRDGKNDLFTADINLSNEVRLTSSGGVVNTFFTKSGDYLVFHVQKEQESSLNIIPAKGGKAIKIADISFFAGVVN